MADNELHELLTNWIKQEEERKTRDRAAMLGQMQKMETSVELLTKEVQRLRDAVFHQTGGSMEVQLAERRLVESTIAARVEALEKTNSKLIWSVISLSGTIIVGFVTSIINFVMNNP